MLRPCFLHTNDELVAPRRSAPKTISWPGLDQSPPPHRREYELTTGWHTVLRRGQVGNIVAVFTVKVWDGEAEMFDLRRDPARGVVDLLMKPDLDAPWSLESSYPAAPEVAELLEDPSVLDDEPSRVFDALVSTNPDLKVAAHFGQHGGR